MSIKITTLHVKGLGHPIKRNKIISLLAKQTSDMLCLQETHSCSDEENLKIKASWSSHILFANALDKKAGVLILINKQINFTLVSEEKDPEGRWIIVESIINNLHATIVNIYGPNAPYPSFWSYLLTQFTQKTYDTLIFCGYMNQMVDFALDRKSSSSFINSKSRNSFQNLIPNLNLLDYWRFCHPQTSDFTFYSSPHQSFSRLDYIFVNSTLAPSILNSKIDPITISDHAPVSTALEWSLPNTFLLRWRVNSFLLKDQSFIDKTNSFFKDFFLIISSNKLRYITGMHSKPP